MGRRFTSSFGALFLAAACASLSAAAPLRYRAYRTSGPIVIDGKPDEAAWARVPETARLRLATVHGENAVPTRADSAAAIHAKILWDGTAVYFHFRVDERYVWNRRSGRDTLGLWMENALEIFLDDAGDNQRYLEVNLAPNGSITDIYNEAKYSGVPGTVLGYDVAGIAAAVDMQGTLCATFAASAPCNQDLDAGFGMEVRLPFASLKSIGPTRIDVVGAGLRAPPRNLDSCRLNLFYTSCPPKDSEPGNPDRINYAWETAVGNDFHETSKSGILTFVDSMLTGGVSLAGGSARRGSEGRLGVRGETTDLAGRRKRRSLPARPPRIFLSGYPPLQP